MVSVATAVICLVGIPLFFGLSIALFFGLQLFKRLRKEDEEFEEEIKQGDDFFQFDDIETWKVDLTKNVKPEDLESGKILVDLEVRQSLQSNRSEDTNIISRSYIPAYRKTFRTRYNEFKEKGKTINLENGSYEGNSKRKSIYEQILPVMEEDVFSHQEMHAQTKAKLLRNYRVEMENVLLGKSLAKQDLGSYYPRS